jgi:twinfilin-like protein
MAIQANLNVSDSLRAKFTDANSPDGPRYIIVRIKSETLVYVDQGSASDDERTDFGGLLSIVSVQDPMFFLWNRKAGSEDNTGWALIAYVPESAKVRSRMLYASSRDDLKTKLGTSFFKGEFYCNDKSDLTYSNFTYALEGATLSSLESVMTEKEILLKEEGMTATSGVATNGMRGVPFKFTAELDTAMQEFGAGGRSLVEIKVNGKTEVCHLGDLAGDATLEQLTSNFPTQPRFFCCNYTRKVFVFFCPENAKVRTKMLLATCKATVAGQAMGKHNIVFDKQIEIRDVSELADAFQVEKAPAAEKLEPVVRAKRQTRGKRRLAGGKKFSWS